MDIIKIYTLKNLDYLQLMGSYMQWANVTKKISYLKCLNHLYFNCKLPF